MRKEEEQYEEHKTNFQGRADSTEIWNRMFPTPRDFPQQK